MSRADSSGETEFIQCGDVPQSPSRRRLAHLAEQRGYSPCDTEADPSLRTKGSVFGSSSSRF
jgi:hypothetical protein